jgi:hypothetical protein
MTGSGASMLGIWPPRETRKYLRRRSGELEGPITSFLDGKGERMLLQAQSSAVKTNNADLFKSKFRGADKSATESPNRSAELETASIEAV